MTQPRATAEDRPRQPHPMTPQQWQEWIWSLYPPNKFVMQWQSYGVTLAVPGGGPGQTNWPTFPAPFYVFNVNIDLWLDEDGTQPAFPVRAGIQFTNGNNWTGGNFSIPTLFYQARLDTAKAPPLLFPREIAQNDVLTLTIDNALNTAGATGDITLDAVLQGYEVRARTYPIQLQDNVPGQLR